MKNLLIVTALLALVAAPGQAAEKTYHFGVSAQRTNVTFESTTDFEVVLGSTRTLEGRVTADLERGVGAVDLVVPIATLDTGIDLRDEHLRSPMWLDAERHPTISFRSKEAKKLADGTWEVEGTFTFHGVSRPLAVQAEVRPIPADLATKAGLEAGEWIRVSVPFQVRLSDFGVSIPEMAAAKVHDLWDVNVVAFASTAPPGATAGP